MGLNTIDHEKQCPLFEGIQARSEFYFLHSYALDSNTGSMTTFSDYSEKFVLHLDLIIYLVFNSIQKKVTIMASK